MNNITILNVGPITNVEIELNKINIIMGPQSSGKSTIAKVISYCQWVEKRYILDGSFNYSFTEQFIKFHRIDSNYFSDDSLIKYESDYVSITYEGPQNKENIRKKQDYVNYEKSKNIYIPAERNFVSVIPNLSKYKESNDNIMSFLYDWYDAKKKYSKENALSILNLGIGYHHIEETDSDILTLSESNKEISLRNASSGLQSVIPLTMLIDYLSDGFYEHSTAISIDENEEMKNVLINNLNHIIDDMSRLKESLNSKNTLELNENESKKFKRIFDLRTKYHHSNFIIEEPEQNLYPETQRDLVYDLLKRMNTSVRNHNAIITTHSPYILYALNNCLMGFNVQESIPEDIKNELLSSDSWINPELISVWEIEKDKGVVRSIKDENTGTISKHYFNKIMNELMNEYYELLNYYEV